MNMGRVSPQAEINLKIKKKKKEFCFCFEKYDLSFCKPDMY